MVRSHVSSHHLLYLYSFILEKDYINETQLVLKYHYGYLNSLFIDIYCKKCCNMYLNLTFIIITIITFLLIIIVIIIIILL